MPHAAEPSAPLTTAPLADAPHAVVAVLGHVDHGKSTLVRLLTGIDPDRLLVEKQMGRSVDLGFAPMSWQEPMPGCGGARVAADLIDLPGHHRYLSNAVDGLHGAEIGLVVVSAMEGWKPQTEEHVRTLSALGVRTILVALTFSDLAGSSRRAEVVEQVRRCLDGRFRDCPNIVEVSPNDASSVAHLSLALRQLVEAEDGRRVRGGVDRPRLWVDRSFAAPGTGRVVTGTLTGGQIRVGDRLGLLTALGSQRCRVRSIECFGEPTSVAGPQRRVGLVLHGLSTPPARGDVLVNEEQWDRGARLWIETEGADLAARGGYHLHLGTARRPCRVGSARFDARRSIRLVRLDADLFGVSVGDTVLVRDESGSQAVVGARVLAVEPRTRAARSRPMDEARLVERSKALKSGVLSAVLRAFCQEQAGAVDPDLARRICGADRAEGLTVGDDFLADPEIIAALADQLRGQLRAEGVVVIPDGPAGRAARAVLLADPEVTADGQLLRSAAAGRATRALVAGAVAELAAAHPGGMVPVAALRQAGIGAQRVRELSADGKLVALAGWAVPIEHFNLLVAKVIPAVARGSSLSSDLRQVLGLSRSATLALLEEMDGRGLTHRVGDRRDLGRAPDS